MLGLHNSLSILFKLEDPSQGGPIINMVLEDPLHENKLWKTIEKQFILGKPKHIYLTLKHIFQQIPPHTIRYDNSLNKENITIKKMINLFCGTL